MSMRILMTSTRGRGHFGPLLPFADAFRRDGHRVLIAVPESATGLLGDRDVWPLREADPDEHDPVRLVVGDVVRAGEHGGALVGVGLAQRPDVAVAEQPGS